MKNCTDDFRKEVLQTLAEYEEMGLWQLILSDIRCFPNIFHALAHLGFYSALFYRLGHFFFKIHLDTIGKVLQLFSHAITGAEISRKAQIGPYLGILHPTGVHIGANAKIGGWFRICENCSVIHNYSAPIGPVIGDHVHLFAGSKVFGDVAVGSHVEIGLNTVVTKNIMPNCTVFGIPARVISRFGK